MKSIARSIVWYSGIDTDIENLVKACNVCKSFQSKPIQKVHVKLPLPERPWSRVHIDHIFYAQKTFLIAIDSLDCLNI